MLPSVTSVESDRLRIIKVPQFLHLLFTSLCVCGGGGGICFCDVFVAVHMAHPFSIFPFVSIALVLRLGLNTTHLMYPIG